MILSLPGINLTAFQADFLIAHMYAKCYTKHLRGVKMTYIAITLLIALFSFQLSAKEIAITFDDSPRFATGYFSGQKRSTTLIKTLKRAGVKEVVFYSVSKNLDKEGVERLNRYANAGHAIANHTHTHPNVNVTSLADYKVNISKAHDLLKDYNNFKLFFRFPFLREGNDLKKRDGLREHLKELGYRNAYITSNNYDWYIESLFQRAVKKDPNFDMKKMKNFYVNVLMESIRYYDEMAVKHLGRSPKHVLLLHEMDISALFIDDLVSALKKEEWKIISSDEAYTDDIANYQTDRIMSYNPGRIGEIARDKGQTQGLWHETCNESYLDKRFAKEVSKF